MSYICSFVVSHMTGAIGARVMFAILALIAVVTFVWRSTSSKFKVLHEEGERHREKERENAEGNEKQVSIKELLFGNKKKEYLSFFTCIIVFYVCWNLLANTWGQFQTYTLVKANATQSFATGTGIVLNIISLITTSIFASVAGSKYRNKAFAVGVLIQFCAMIGMALSGSALWTIVICIGCYNLGNPVAGEAIYKVWTQESFPSENRAALQGFINGFSRLCCGLFAFITPVLVLPEHIRTTMFGFSGIVVVSALAVLKLGKAVFGDADIDLPYAQNGREFTMSLNSNEMVDLLVKAIKASASNIENINSEFKIGLTSEEIAQFKSIMNDKNINSEIQELKTMIAGSNISLKEVFSDNTYTQDIKMAIQLKDFGKMDITVKGKSTKSDAKEITIPTSSVKLTEEEYLKLMEDDNVTTTTKTAA